MKPYFLSFLLIEGYQEFHKNIAENILKRSNNKKISFLNSIEPAKAMRSILHFILGLFTTNKGLEL